jgi:hypothetical protein
MLMEIPFNIHEEKGRAELVEKGMTIGRILTINTESLYHLTGVDLLKATVRSAALQGYGYIRVTEFQSEENLVVMRQTIHPAFTLKPYLTFLEGFYRGIIKKALRREIRTIKFDKMEIEPQLKVQRATEPTYIIRIRMSPEKHEENVLEE